MKMSPSEVIHRVVEDVTKLYEGEEEGKPTREQVFLSAIVGFLDQHFEPEEY